MLESIWDGLEVLKSSLDSWVRCVRELLGWTNEHEFTLDGLSERAVRFSHVSAPCVSASCFLRTERFRTGCFRTTWLLAS